MAPFVRLLGKPAIYFQDEWLEPASSKVSALLYYLAYLGRWVSRSDLAFLFWADVPEVTAKKNLRNLLHRVRALDYIEGFESEVSRISWQVKTDVAKFKEAVANKNYAGAVKLYKGELLESFRLDNAFEFTEWLGTEREELARHFQQAALVHIVDLEEIQKFQEAAQQLEQLRKTDPFNEDLLRRQLRNMQASQQISEVLAKFEQFQTQLAKEFGVTPELTTLELVDALQQASKEPKPIAETRVETVQTPKILHNLPSQLLPFIGREIEQKRVAEQLSDPACRLLTLSAPGGMGKTSLALAVAQDQLGNFKDGVIFVPFASVKSAEQMVFVLADALGLALNVKYEAKMQVVSYLAKKSLLLVMDNLEHLLKGVALFSELLETAPGVKILATSREQLLLHSEWVINLRGLDYPSKDAANPETYDALKFFAESAKRVQADFVLDKVTLPLVTKCLSAG